MADAADGAENLSTPGNTHLPITVCVEDAACLMFSFSSACVGEGIYFYRVIRILFTSFVEFSLYCRPTATRAYILIKPYLRCPVR